MKKITLLSLMIFTTIVNAQNFRSTTLGNSAILVNAGFTNLTRINIIPYSPDTIKLCLYNSATLPTAAASTPVEVFQINPGLDAYPNIILGSHKYPLGCWARVANGGVIGKADTYTVQPSVAPDVQIGY